MDINRKAAYLVLFSMEKEQSYSNITLNQVIKKERPDNEAFVREIVYGVVKNQILIDYYLDRLIPSGIKKIKKQDIVLLRMGIYQLKFMGSVPEYAAVNETVVMAKAFCKGRDKFINGVLRGYIKKQEELLLPDMEKDIVNYMHVKYSVAKSIIRLWLDVYGRNMTEELLSSLGDTPNLVIRVNTLKITACELKKLLEEKGYRVLQTPLSHRALFVWGSNLLSLREYEEGLFSVQDLSSIIACDAFSPKEKEIVMDLCAAPGGKTVAMAEAMGNCGKVISMDIYPHKLELINDYCKRNHIDIVQTVCGDSSIFLEKYIESADKVLADVPCSGLGVFRRKPEIKLREIDDLEELIGIQRKILMTGSRYVKKGGYLMYSTCTINPSENQNQIEWFLSNNNQFEKVLDRQLTPIEGVDGFYYCILKKL